MGPTPLTPLSGELGLISNTCTGMAIKDGQVAFLMTTEIFPCLCMTKSDTTRSTVVIQVNIFQNELMVEIYFKSLVDIGKVSWVSFS